MSFNNNFPSTNNYVFPPEWAKHLATWLTWPHKEASWPGKLEAIYAPYCKFIEILSLSEIVRINVIDEEMKNFALSHIKQTNADISKIEFYYNPSNDAWCRDHGPAFLINPLAQNKKVIIDWDFNAWGNKYPPYNLDDVIPTKIAQHFDLPLYCPCIIMEGGSVEFNGAGTVLTSKSCLLNKNRNPHLSQAQIEEYLKNYYGVQQVLWVSDGIIGDDTDGHIDDTVRFVNHNTVLTVVESDVNDENYQLLQTNLQELKAMRLLNGQSLNIIELPMPSAVIYEDVRLPASYANFYISNAHVIVPTYNCVNDAIALKIIGDCFPDRETVGINSTDIIWGLGSFHCLSQQEPLV